MSVIRAFIAIDLSPEIQRHLETVIDQLKERLPAVPVRWVGVKNIHLTLKFLGDVSVANIDMLKNLILTEVRGHSAFDLSVGELGAFPSISRPRVVWVGVKAPSELSAIQRGIETQTDRLGYTREDRDFSPHLTLGRVSRGATPQDIRKISEALNAMKVGYLGTTRIQAVHLYRSDLQPGGAIYSQLYSAPLNPVQEKAGS